MQYFSSGTRPLTKCQQNRKAEEYEPPGASTSKRSHKLILTCRQQGLWMFSPNVRIKVQQHNFTASVSHRSKMRAGKEKKRFTVNKKNYKTECAGWMSTYCGMKANVVKAIRFLVLLIHCRLRCYICLNAISKCKYLISQLCGRNRVHSGL